MEKRVRFIYNPLSGLGASAIVNYLDDISRTYADRGISVEPYEIDFGAADTELFGDEAERCEHLLIAGGDGTINFVVNRMLTRGIDIPIAVIPSGTANDFASTIGMNRNPLQACRQILDGEARRVDLGCVNGNYFVNVFSFGLFTNVSQRTPTALKNSIGRAAYIMGGMEDLMHIHTMPVSIHSDDGDFEGQALIVLAFNGKTAGSFKLARMAEIDDGYLDVLVLRSGTVPMLSAVPTFLYYIFGGIGEPPRDVMHFHCRTMRIESSKDEPTDVDGQPGPALPVELGCRHGAIRLVMPQVER